MNDKMLEVMSWIFGEFGHLTNNNPVYTAAGDEIDTDKLLQLMCLLLEQPHFSDHIKAWILNALIKLTQSLDGYSLQFVFEAL